MWLIETDNAGYDRHVVELPTEATLEHAVAEARKLLHHIRVGRVVTIERDGTLVKSVELRN